MSMNVSNVSFGSKFGEQKAAKFFGNKSAKIVDSAHKQAIERLNMQRPVVEQQEIAIRNSMNKICESKLFKGLYKILDNPLFRAYKEIFKVK